MIHSTFEHYGIICCQKYFGRDSADANANFPGFYDKIIVLDGLGLAEDYMIHH